MLARHTLPTFEPGMCYREHQFNDLRARHTDDPATIRRALSGDAVG